MPTNNIRLPGEAFSHSRARQPGRFIGCCRKWGFVNFEEITTRLARSIADGDVGTLNRRATDDDNVTTTSAIGNMSSAIEVPCLDMNQNDAFGLRRVVWILNAST
jgi:hypothetical protein